MKTRRPRPARAILLALLFAAGLWLLVGTYVPTVRPFRAAFFPVLLLLLAVTAADARKGTILFVFLFPLVNNLPYFFGLGSVALAPTALVLFLFFFLGWLAHRVRRPGAIVAGEPLFRPLLAFGLLVALSAVITFLRYANFFPFLSDRIYDMTASTLPVSTGAAIMSVVLFSLNYLTGLAFFFILTRTVSSRADIRNVTNALALSAVLSLGFGLVQHLRDIRLGNSPNSLVLELVNATFKDSLSFGAFLAMTVPLWLGLCLAGKKAMRAVFLLAIAGSLYLLMFTGSKSALLSLGAALALLALFGVLEIRRQNIAEPARRKKTLRNAAVALALVLALGVSLAVVPNPVSKKIAGSVTLSRWKYYGLSDLIRGRNLGLLFQIRATLLWKQGVAMVRDYPLTGVGMGAYIIETANYASKFHFSVYPESAENYPLQVAAELGVVGLLAVAWLLFEILKLARKTYRRLPATDPLRFVLVGGASGIAAFLLIIQTHTFIGSYEVKYTFWLFIGIIFALSRLDIPEAGRPPRSAIVGKKEIIAGLVILVLYGALHLWNSTHSLSLAARTREFGLKQKFGLGRPERTADGREFCWTREYGGMPLKVEKPVLVLPLQAAHPDIQKKPVRVRIYLVKNFFKHKTFLKEITLSRNEWRDIVLSVPEDVGQEAILLIKVSRTWNPLKTTGVPDPRNLGVAVGKVTFRDK